MQDTRRPHARTNPTARRSIALAALAAIAAFAAPALAQADGASDIDTELRRLFVKSFDLFTIMLVIGSIVSVAVIIQCVWEIRRKNIVPPHAAETVLRLAKFARWGELRDYVNREDDSMLSRVVRAGLDSPGADRSAVREAAEIAAGEESTRWFRKVEPLNVIGNLGPLLGLAGTVWGMIIAFTTLTAGGGQADPNALAGGIAKALFHTLLGLLLAIPSLLAFGLYRTFIDKHCTRAMSVAGSVIEMLPESPIERGVVARIEHAGGVPSSPPTPPAAPRTPDTARAGR